MNIRYEYRKFTDLRDKIDNLVVDKEEYVSPSVTYVNYNSKGCDFKFMYKGVSYRFNNDIVYKIERCNGLEKYHQTNLVVEKENSSSFCECGGCAYGNDCYIISILKKKFDNTTPYILSL